MRHLGRFFLRRLVLPILLALAWLSADSAAAQTFTDNSFTTGWYTFVYAKSPSTATVTAAAGPFPSISPNRRRLTHSYHSGASIFAHHLGMTQHYLPGGGQIANISFKYTIAAVAGNVGYAPLIVQGGSFYSRPFDTATSSSTAYTHVMTAADFHLIKPDGSLDPTQHPDFSCTGPATQMGYNTFSSDAGPINPANALSSVSDLSAWEVVVTTQPCGTSSTSSACCPPWTKASMMAQLRLFQPGSILSPYTFKFLPTSPYQAQMQAYINYLNALNPSITTLTVDWRITDQGNGTSPVAATTSTIVATSSNSWTCSGTCLPPPPNTTFPLLNLTPNNWYRVTARLKLNGGLTYWPPDCPVASFDYIIRII